MKISVLFVVCATGFLSACATYDGLFEPACVAYEGDRIELHDGRFIWQKFTDVKLVDQDGNAIDPFPGFPKTGRFEVASNRIVLHDDNGAHLDDFYAHKHGSHTYLLTADQNEATHAGEQLPVCALRRADTTQ